MDWSTFRDAPRSRGIGLLGSVAILFNNITGPGLINCFVSPFSLIDRSVGGTPIPLPASRLAYVIDHTVSNGQIDLSYLFIF